ncbi:Glucan endo-1,3-beta-glucosidase [Quillaja saponaria]|uniref:glucan endo-1,3-beta-D-glucosidase n=1 Tax=Quillaja saponaria TaxID=32244 RepID=A0AAD7M5Z2_QUISA|nr:Glucan endo-1,3-beta-glucosidase [Quillaja saponaria]
MKDNGFDKVKLFEADPEALKAIAKSGIQVMFGIPNDHLATLASSVQISEEWVSQNNFGDRFLKTIFPALQNIQAALIKAGLGRQVKVTVPLNADAYLSENGVRSGGNFKSDIRDLVLTIINFLNDNDAPLTANIYPFFSLYIDPNFPKDYAFFNGSAVSVIDGSISYTNILDANFDTLIAALEKNGFGSMPFIVGEVGWPTDGDPNANIENAQRFNQGLVDRIVRKQGTPKRATPPDMYVFALLDEDDNSNEPGNFERHWGVFNNDGTVKYPLNLGGRKPLVATKGRNRV